MVLICLKSTILAPHLRGALYWKRNMQKQVKAKVAVLYSDNYCKN